MKREKPIEGRPQLWLSENENRTFVTIFYPKGHGWPEILVLESDHDWYRSYYSAEMLTKFNKFMGWKTHFLGNL